MLPAAPLNPVNTYSEDRCACKRRTPLHYFHVRASLPRAGEQTFRRPHVFSFLSTAGCLFFITSRAIHANRSISVWQPPPFLSGFREGNEGGEYPAMGGKLEINRQTAKRMRIANYAGFQEL